MQHCYPVAVCGCGAHDKQTVYTNKMNISQKMTANQIDFVNETLPLKNNLSLFALTL